MPTQCECTKYKVDLDVFYWKPLPIISKHFTLKELLSEKLSALINSDEILNTELSTFEAVACTSLYVLTDKEQYIEIHIGMDSNEIEYIKYLVPFHQNMRFHHWKTSIDKYEYSESNPIKKKYTFSKEDYTEISTVSQELLDTIRVKCENGQVANKDGYRMDS